MLLQILVHKTPHSNLGSLAQNGSHETPHSSLTLYSSVACNLVA